MHVEVDLFGPFRERAGTDSVSLSLPEAATVGDAIAELEAETGLSVDADNTTVTVDGTNVRQREGVETELADGQTLRLAPPVVGGVGSSLDVEF